jgi:hypothetical protein
VVLCGVLEPVEEIIFQELVFWQSCNSQSSVCRK